MFVLFLPAIIKLFPQILQSASIPLLPSSAIHTLSGSAEGIEYVGMIAAVVVLCLWLLIFGIIGFHRFKKKDI